MSKLRLLIGVGLCGILFAGCSFFDYVFGSKSNKSVESDEIQYGTIDCVPSDLVKRLASKKYYDGVKTYQTPEQQFKNYIKRYGKIFEDYRYDGTGITKCYDLVIESYNEVLKNAKTLPTNINNELAFEKEWLVCDKMPLWLETKLDEYINQNRGDDIAYINASKFKSAWNSKLTDSNKYVWGGEFLRNDIGRMANCVAYKAAIKAIENDLIDLGNGKKAKCADLSYDDAPKCLDYFVSVYDKAYKDKEKELKAEQKEINIKKERMKYEQINRR